MRPGNATSEACSAAMPVDYLSLITAVASLEACAAALFPDEGLQTMGCPPEETDEEGLLTELFAALWEAQQLLDAWLHNPFAAGKRYKVVFGSLFSSLPVRTGIELSTGQVGQLKKGQVVRIVKEEWDSTGTLRGLMAPEEKHQGWTSIATPKGTTMTLLASGDVGKISFFESVKGKLAQQPACESLPAPTTTQTQTPLPDSEECPWSHYEVVHTGRVPVRRTVEVESAQAGGLKLGARVKISKVVRDGALNQRGLLAPCESLKGWVSISKGDGEVMRLVGEPGALTQTEEQPYGQRTLSMQRKMVLQCPHCGNHSTPPQEGTPFQTRLQDQSALQTEGQFPYIQCDVCQMACCLPTADAAVLERGCNGFC